MQSVTDRINELFIATDEKAWPRVRACFAHEVLFDMSSLTGQPAAMTPAHDIVTGWESGLAALDAVHHQSGNFRVEVRTHDASAFCYAIAYHYRKTASGKNTRVFVGSYDFHLVHSAGTWLIDRFKFNAKFVDGNLNLETEPRP